MSNDLDSRISVKLFVGCMVSPNMHHLLNKSTKWKEAQIMRSHQIDDTGCAFCPTSLGIINYHDKEYVGQFMPDAELTLAQLEEKVMQIRKELAEYCPDFDICETEIAVFPQVFIS